MYFSPGNSKMYLTYIPPILQRWMPRYLWRVATGAPEVYLTFDDGPMPGVTPWVLEQLDVWGAKASFFWVGQQVDRHPDLAREVLAAGHTVGNHTWQHLDAWKTSPGAYLADIQQAQASIQAHTGVEARLFRPPYGHLSRTQGAAILRTHEVVMMDVISGDFDTRMSGAVCHQRVMRHVRPGSIVLLHDSQKAWERLRIALPLILRELSGAGYAFRALS
ncbi:MAG: polysaccharide deacetylase family protein [Bacteroidia bacterium]|nr:polysaccharide deacetylase family protein [Bacteroidia bacterium]